MTMARKIWDERERALDGVETARRACFFVRASLVPGILFLVFFILRARIVLGRRSFSYQDQPVVEGFSSSSYAGYVRDMQRAEAFGTFAALFFCGFLLLCILAQLSYLSFIRQVRLVAIHSTNRKIRLDYGRGKRALRVPVFGVYPAAAHFRILCFRLESEFL